MQWKSADDSVDGPDVPSTDIRPLVYAVEEGGARRYGSGGPGRLPDDPSTSPPDDAPEDLDGLRRFYRLSPTACLSLGRDGLIRRCNPAAARLLATCAEGLVGASFADYLCAEHRTAFAYLLASAFSRGHVDGQELRLAGRADGRERTVLAEVSRGEGDHHCILLLTDMTERRRMGGALDELEAFSIGVLNSLPWHIAVIDQEGVIRAVNTAWQRFAIESGAEWLALNSIGMSYRQACRLLDSDPSAEQAREAWMGIERVFRGEVERFTLEYSCHAPDRLRWFELTASPLLSARPGVVVAHCDITARKLAELSLDEAKQQAERANNAKSRLLAAVSHDLRQPLAALGLYVGLLQQECDGREASLVRSMNDCVASLSALLTDVLDLGRLEAGALKPKVRDAPVNELLDRVVSVNAPEAMLKRLSLRRAHCPAGWTVRTDPVLFARILDNLVSNAVRYTDRGGVLIGCRRAQGRRWLEVWDSGVGIAQESIREIFDEYRQLDNADRTRGSGLGLAIADKLARLLGLRIRVHSIPGKGSMFAVEMPPGRACRSDGDGEPPLRKVRIALTGIDTAASRGVGEALRSYGHQVEAAPDAASLLPPSGSWVPDVVVAACGPQGVADGFDAIGAMRLRFGEQLPAVLLTDGQDGGLQRSLADRGVVVQCTPVAPERLASCIALLTERRTN
jgi:PAS domain S-box-containing protein